MIRIWRNSRIPQKCEFSTWKWWNCSSQKNKKQTVGGYLTWTFSRFRIFKLQKLHFSWFLNLYVIIPVRLGPVWAESDEKRNSYLRPELGVKIRCPELGANPCNAFDNMVKRYTPKVRTNTFFEGIPIWCYSRSKIQNTFLPNTSNFKN